MKSTDDVEIMAASDEKRRYTLTAKPCASGGDASSSMVMVGDDQASANK